MTFRHFRGTLRTSKDSESARAENLSRRALYCTFHTTKRVSQRITVLIDEERDPLLRTHTLRRDFQQASGSPEKFITKLEDNLSIKLNLQVKMQHLTKRTTKA